MKSKNGIFTAKEESKNYSWEICKEDDYFVGWAYKDGDFECGGREILLSHAELRELADFIEYLQSQNS